MLFSDRQKVNAVLNTEVEDTFDKNGVFVKNINLKSVDIAKKHQDKVNEYLATHKKTTSNPVIANSMGIGDNFKIPVNIGNSYTSMQTKTKTCSFCGYKNTENSISCANCGKKLN